MKMISSTSITSTSGVTLMSAIGARRPRPRCEGRFIAIGSAISTSSWRLSVAWKPSAKRFSRASIRLMPWLKRL